LNKHKLDQAIFLPLKEFAKVEIKNGFKPEATNQVKPVKVISRI
jgi:hypothetical protein